MAKTTARSTAPAAELVLVTVKALEPIRADGVDYAPGDEFDVSDDDAQALAGMSAAELATAKK